MLRAKNDIKNYPCSPESNGRGIIAFATGKKSFASGKASLPEKTIRFNEKVEKELSLDVENLGERSWKVSSIATPNIAVYRCSLREILKEDAKSSSSRRHRPYTLVTSKGEISLAPISARDTRDGGARSGDDGGGGGGGC
ncbi:hypothetical protein HZH68_002464 [Vespula germanica]|uniref:Uncharacterized protein n=1 Tax=Vespula germanica TaxID=30212 RepID=A0A834NMD7_VESGE|nr:hypothetical protein HZH68_002464 [Vespula germanica]